MYESHADSFSTQSRNKTVANVNEENPLKPDPLVGSNTSSY
jgi:hypothetical protein